MKQLLSLVGLLFFSLIAQAQPFTIGPAGQTSTVGGTSFSWTLGQPILSSVTQNPDQPMQIGFQSGYSNAEEIDSSIARYYIGNMPDAFDLFHGDPNAFYFLSPLNPQNAKLSYKLSRPIAGVIELFDSTIIIKDTVFAYIRFKIPATETRQFAITFSGGITQGDTQRVLINPIKNPPMEVRNFGVGNTQKYPDITGRSYIIALDDSSGATQYMNGAVRSVRDVEVAGVSLKIDRTMPLGPGNIYARFHSDQELKNANIRSLSLYTDTLYVNDEIRLPGTQVTIYARRVVFKDRPGFPLSAINTTPYGVITPATTDTLGLPGTDAGSIRFFVKECITDPKFRFIQAGGTGQNGKFGAGLIVTTRNGKPGNGGDFVSGLEIGNYSDRSGGYPGSGGPLSTPLKGKDGKFQYTGDTIHWLHPHYVKLVHRYADDLYMLGKTEAANAILRSFQYEILDYQANGFNFPQVNNSVLQYERGRNGLEMLVLGAKINASLSRIESGLDYYGFTPGYVPLLSNEFLLSIYKNQVNSTMSALFLADMVRSANLVQISVANRKLAAINGLRASILEDTASINRLVANSFLLNSKVDANTVQLNGLKTELAALVNSLEARANKIRNDQRKKAKKRKIGKIIQTVGNATAMVPTPWTMGIGTALSIGGGLYADPPQNTMQWIQAGFDATQKIQAAFTKTQYSQEQMGIASNYNTLVSNGFCQNQAFLTCAQQQGQAAAGLIGPFQESISNIIEIAKGNSVGVQQVDEIMAGLRAQEPRFQQILDKTAEIQKENLSFLDNIRSNIAQTEVASNRILGNMLAIDALSYQGSNAISRVNMNMVQYVNDMENDNFFRLKKYQYLLAKSYEYRTCKPYPGDMSVDSVFFQLRSMVTQANCPSANCTLTQSQLNTLSDVFYLKAVKPIMDGILDDVIGGSAPLTSSTFTYSLNPEDLKKLNRDKGFIFNPLEQYPQLFDMSQEDYRIVNLKVDKIYARRASGQPFANANDNITLRIKYPAIAKTKRQGQIYFFSNFDINGDWPIQYGGTVRPAQGNAMDDIRWNEDLKWLCYMLNYNGATTNCEDLRSRSIANPPFWADMPVSLTTNLFNSLPQGDSVVIDSVKFQLTYSYRPAPPNTKLKIVKMNEPWMEPVIEFSQADVNGKQDGYGELYRTYFTGSNVSIKAPRKYGNYRFSRWGIRYSNSANTIFSSDTLINTASQLDGTFTAYYVPAKEVIEVSDTVYVSGLASTETNEDTVIVKGRGTVGTASEFVTDSLITSGVGNLAFASSIDGRSGLLDSLETSAVSLDFSANPGATKRYLGKIFTFAPEDDKFIHETVVMQKPNPTAVSNRLVSGALKVVPNPNRGTFNVQLPDDCCVDARFELTDIMGRSIEEGLLLGGSQPEVKLKNASPGIYMLKVLSNGKLFSSRLVIE